MQHRLVAETTILAKFHHEVCNELTFCFSILHYVLRDMMIKPLAPFLHHRLAENMPDQVKLQDKSTFIIPYSLFELIQVYLDGTE